MHLRRWQWIIVACAVLILGGVVGAIVGWWSREQLELKDDSVRSSGQSQVLKGQRVANDIWGNVCAGAVTISFVPLEGSIAGQASSFIDPQGNHSQCTVAITDKRPFKDSVRCAIIVHEYGHLEGHDHSKDQDDVMYPTITKKNIPTGCM